MNLPAIALGLIAGVLAGGVFYATLWWNVRAWAEGGSPVRVLVVQLARLAIVAAVLVAVARLGALPLLAALLGIIATRLVATRFVARQA